MLPRQRRAKRVLLILLLCLRLKRLRKKRREELSRRFWVKPLWLERQQHGQFHMHVQHMREKDEESHFEYFRMSAAQFDELHTLVKDKIYKCDTSFRDSISTAERLAVTLRFLASGDSQQSTSFGFLMGRSTVSSIIKETCEALYEALQEKYMKFPSSASEWEKVADGFNSSWNFPNCIGAIDGKHCAIQSPANSGSQYYNYKNHFSILLMAICDADYVFTYVDVGHYGSNNDAGVFGRSELCKGLQEKHFNVPANKLLPGSDVSVPYCLVGDEAFPLKTFMMRPYPGRNLTNDSRIFNYRLSRARRCIENAFGILASRFRILRRSMIGKPENIDAIIKCCLCLHNYLMISELARPSTSRRYCPRQYVDREDVDGNIIPGHWRDENAEGLGQATGLGGNMHSLAAAAIRNSIREYFVSPAGMVPWQYERAFLVRGGV